MDVNGFMRLVMEYADANPDDPNVVAFLAEMEKLRAALAEIDWPKGGSDG